MKKVVFVNPPKIKNSDEFIEEYNRIPLSLCYLASSTRKAGIDSYIIDAQVLNLTAKEIVKRIKKINPEFVAITILSDFLESSKELAFKIKRECPNVKLIVGGSHISSNLDSVMNECKYFDIAVHGESDKIISDIIKVRNLELIKGIAFRKGKKIVKTNFVRDRVKNLDELPFPSFDLLEGFPGLYGPTPNMFQDVPSINLMTARGCLWNCSFCHQSVFGNDYSYNSYKNIISMIEFLQKKYDVKDVCFYDDVFTIPRSRTVKFCQELIRRGIKISWSCQSRIDVIDYELPFLMKKAGCWQISFGIESGSDKILKILNKKITREKIIEKSKEIKKSGMRFRAFFIMGSPGETNETIEETKSLIKEIQPDDLLFEFYTPMKGTSLEKQVHKYGIVKSFTNTTFRVNFIPKDMTEKELQKHFKNIQIKFYLKPRVLFYYVKQFFNPKKTKYLLEGFLTYIKIMMK